MRGYTELNLGSLDELRVSVVPHQGATLLSLLADAFGGRGHGVPARWRSLVHSAVSEVGPDVLRPMFAPGYSIIPDCITPSACMPGGDVAAQCEQLADLAPGTLLAELEVEFGPAVPAQWRPVVEQPRKWLQDYTRLLRSVWREFQPVWTSAQGLIGAETERVGSAVVRGFTDGVLQGLSGRFRLVGESFRMPDPQADTYELAGRRLVLVPIVSGPGASLFALDLPGLVWIGYPLPGMGRLWQGATTPADPAADPLILVVGRLRAAILRVAAQPLTMGEMAALIGCSPANATHHCRHLADAGLLERRAEGRHVRISRTERGNALVDLLSQADAVTGL